MRRRICLAALITAACGGLEGPDLSTGGVAGRLDPAYPTGRAYVLGRPELRASLDADGLFAITGIPVGDVVVVVYDGRLNMGERAATVRGAEVTWIGPAAGSVGENGEPLPPSPATGGQGSDGGADLPLAGAIRARALAGGVPLAEARFTVEGTDLLAIAPGVGGDALLAPLPPGTFEVVARADGYAEARAAVTVPEGDAASVDLLLTP